MAANADSVVVELIAKTEQLDKPVQQSAAQFDANMNKIVASATKAEAAVNSLETTSGAAMRRQSAQISQFSSMLSRDMDLVSAKLLSSSSPFVAPVKQAPAVASAMRLVSAGAGLMGGVLETVATGGVALLAIGLFELIGNLHKSGDGIDALVEKLKENYKQDKLNEEANRAFLKTYEGASKDIDEVTAALEKENRTLEDNIRLKQQSLFRDIEALQKQRASLIEQLADQQRQLGQANAMAGGGFLDKDAIIHHMADIGRQIAVINGQIAKAAAGTVAAAFPLIEQRAKDAVDAIAAINHKFDEEAAAAKKAGTYTQDFANNLEKQRKAAIEAAQANERLSKSAGEYGRQVSFADAAAIAKNAGLTVTSAFRSTAHQAELYNDPSVNRPGNPVARPGTSAHEGVNGKWALDIAFAPGLTAQSLKKLYGDQGVSLSAVYKEAGHFHIEGSRSQAAQQEQAATSLARQEFERARQFAAAKADLEGQILDARKDLGLSAHEIADIEHAAADAAVNAYENDVKAREEEGKYTKAGADDLIKMAEVRRGLLHDLIERRRQQAEFAQQEQRNENALTVQTGLLDTQQELLRSQEGLARTASERREIEDRLIDIEFEEERMRLQAQISLAARLRAEANRTKAVEDIAAAERAEADAAVARSRLANLPAQQANAHTANAQQNVAPLQSYLNDIPDSAERINEALEGIAVNGLQSFVDGLADAVVHFQSLSDVGLAALQGLEGEFIKLALRLIVANTLGKLFGNSMKSGGEDAKKLATETAAKIAAVTAQQAALQAIQASFGAATAATAAATAAAVGAAWAPAAAAAALATLGGNAAPAAAALVSTNALSTALAIPRADGGPVFGPGGPRGDKILVAASDGEYVINAQSAGALGRGTLDFINDHGALPGFANGGRIQPVNARAAQPGWVLDGITANDIRRLETAVRESQANISLYASLDPADMLQRALGAPAGHRALIAHLGRNSTAVKATLNRPGS